MRNDDYDPDGPGARRQRDADGEVIPRDMRRGSNDTRGSGNDHCLNTKNPYSSQWIGDADD